MIKKLMVFFVATMAAIGAWAATETVNGITWTYTVSGGSATITDVPTYISNQVEIPQSLNGYQVECENSNWKIVGTGPGNPIQISTNCLRWRAGQQLGRIANR